MSPWVKVMAGYDETGLRHHAGREIYAHRVNTAPGQEGADVARTAPEVADGVTLVATAVASRPRTCSGCRGRTACGPAPGGNAAA